MVVSSNCDISRPKLRLLLQHALQHADDAVFPSLTADVLQRSLGVISEIYLRAGLIINTTKTEIPTFSISGKQLKNTELFIYLGSNHTFSGNLTNEIQRCSDLASSVLDCLSNCVFGNHNLTIHTKIAVYNAVLITIILYGWETWVPHHRQIRLLESFHIRRLQLVLGLCWWHKLTYSDIRSRAGTPSIKYIFLYRQLRWLGHIIRMPDSRLPHRVLHGQLRLRHMSVSGQWKHFKDHIKTILKKCNIPFNRLEALTSNRATYRPVPLECHALTPNTIELQHTDAVADTSML